MRLAVGALIRIVAVKFRVLTAARQEGLHLENVSTSGISASLKGNLEEVADARRQGLRHLKSSLDLALTLQENEAETKAEEMSKRILQVFLGSKHEGLHDCLHTFLMASADEN